MPEKNENQSRKDEILKYQQLQQQLQALSAQKQTFQIQETEVNNALKELEAISQEQQVYESIGTILIKREPITLKESLNSKKEVIKLRLESLNKQLDRVTIKLQELQKKLTGGLS